MTPAVLLVVREKVIWVVDKRLIVIIGLVYCKQAIPILPIMVVQRIMFVQLGQAVNMAVAAVMAGEVVYPPVTQSPKAMIQFQIRFYPAVEEGEILLQILAVMAEELFV